MAVQIYKTKQRSLILKIFTDNKDHCFTAKEMIGILDGQLGEATVYRMLSKLSEEGVLQKYLSEDGRGSIYRLKDCCGRENHTHFHLRCSECGRLVHMDCGAMAEISRHLLKEHGFIMDNAKTVLQGRCVQCNCHKKRCDYEE